MIVCEDLTKEFVVGLRRKKIVALKGLNLKIEKGEIFGFLGPNGAGKTTTLKILMGLIYQTSGRASVLDKPVGNVNAKRKIGFLPESPYFYDYLTAEEFLMFYGQLFGISKSNLVKRLDELFSLIRLSDSRTLRLRRFSKGMLQRIGIAQALINDPTLVILDEPMSGLDPVGRKEIRDLILHLKEKGKTVFFSSHILSDAEMICDRVGILFNGKLIEIGRVEDLVRSVGVKSVEMVVEGINQETADRLKKLAVKVVVNGSQTLLFFDQDRVVDDALGLIYQNNARLVSLVRQKYSLEDLFMKEVCQDSKFQGQ